MTILVAIPYFKCAPYIDQAVDHVLAQTYRDLICLVAGDGEVPPVSRSDDRLVVTSFPVNRGAPFTQQAMLYGNPFDWYAPHGADDWVEPEYLERLIGLGAAANAAGALWHYRDLDEYGLPMATPYREMVNDHAYAELGVFDTGLLRSVGGYGIDRRCGQDTLLYADIVSRVTRIAWADHAMYWRLIRDDSLTRDPATGYGSAYRTEVAQHNGEIARACERIGWGDVEGIRAFRELLTERTGLKGELEDRIAQVRAVLS